MRKIVFLLGLILIATILPGQRWCDAQMVGALPAEKPASSFAKQEITIPVVVHVVWHEMAENISDAQIQSQLEVLNEDFRAQNIDLEFVLPNFMDAVADMEINFELATQDPLGQPHSGIIRVATPWDEVANSFVTEPGPDLGKRRICYDDFGGSSAWCTDCYLNIWVGDLVGGLGGFATFPFEVGNEVPRAEDGVFIAPDRFGALGTVEDPYDLGRTLTHEVGHYLNLFHPWGPEALPDPCSPSVCCEDPIYDDQVDDTPRQNATYQGECPGGNQFTCGTFDNFQNFMNYSDDACLLMFTEGQKARVWAALETYRPGLMNPDCQAMCVTSTVIVEPITSLLGEFSQLGDELTMETLVADIDWQLIDALGRPLSAMQSGPPAFYRWSIGDLPSGLYYLHARWGRSISTKKIIIVR